MRLGDLDALLEKVQFRIPCDSEVAAIVNECVKITKHLIENAPTIDAEPVRHAKILYNVAIEKEECCGYKKRKGFVLQKYTCSSCYTSIPGESKFCMECGAKLDGGTENDTS